ncbi:MAG: glycosyltransferase [Lachnospiraceae bacterium]|nr:glycosyltransferase [Lachnospiraceae bacterium]
MEEKYVSIILPTYNRGHLIQRSIESIRRQTYRFWELLIVDDGSTDNTRDIVAEIAAADTRVHYYRQQQNKGVSVARNEGIKNSKFEYFAFQDSDDIWKEDKLEKQMRVFAEKPEVGLVYCSYEGIKADGTKVSVPNVSVGADNLQGWIYDRLLVSNVIGGPTAVIRKACLEKCQVQGQFFDENLTCLEDWELFLRIAQNFELGFVAEPLLIADIHEGGVSSKVGGYFHARCVMVARHKKALLEYGIFNQVVEQILMMAKQAGAFNQVVQMMQQILAG